MVQEMDRVGRDQAVQHFIAQRRIEGILLKKAEQYSVLGGVAHLVCGIYTCKSICDVHPQQLEQAHCDPQ